MKYRFLEVLLQDPCKSTSSIARGFNVDDNCNWEWKEMPEYGKEEERQKNYQNLLSEHRRLAIESHIQTLVKNEINEFSAADIHWIEAYDNVTEEMNVDTGVQDICKVLLLNPTIKKIDLSGVKVSTMDDKTAVANLLKTRNDLTSIKFLNCGLSDANITQILVEALQYNSVITEITLENLHIDAVTPDKIKWEISQRKGAEELVKIAQSPTSTLNDLRFVTNHRHATSASRAAAVANTNADAAFILEEVNRAEADKDTLLAAVRNPNTSLAGLKIIVAHPHTTPACRVAAVANANADAALILAEVSRIETNEDVFLAAVSNPLTDIAGLRAIITHPHATPQILIIIAKRKEIVINKELSDLLKVIQRYKDPKPKTCNCCVII